MNDYTINVTEIEELQNTNNTAALEAIFSKAKSAVVNGVKVLLVRKDGKQVAVKFDELDTLEGLEEYKAQVMKYTSTPGNTSPPGPLSRKPGEGVAGA